MKELSIIIPTLNEAAGIAVCLQSLQTLRRRGCEIILVDGGSEDETAALAQPYVDLLLHAPRGRAAQMNSGARAASGKILLFLHADSLLPEHADELILEGIASSGKNWGRFDIAIAGTHPLLRLVERLMNLRSRLTGVTTGDQGLFVTGELFHSACGFPEIALMEDIALGKKLGKHSFPLCLKQKIITSARRWESQGVLRTIFLMWRLRLAYLLGADPEQLALAYYERKS